MKKTLKKMVCASMAAVLALGLTVSPAMADEAHAATKKPYMKTLKLKWDLKKNKTVKITEPWAGIGKKPATMTIKNMKISKAKKAGYKKLTFTVVCKRTWTPTKGEVHKLVNKANGSFGSGMYVATLDYKTGLDCEDVTMKLGEWKWSNYKTVTDSHGCWFRVPRTAKVKVTVTYPEDYKDLCVGVGGLNQIKETKADKKLGKKGYPFGKSSLYKKGKTNSHWMRIK